MAWRRGGSGGPQMWTEAWAVVLLCLFEGLAQPMKAPISETTPKAEGTGWNPLPCEVWEFYNAPPLVIYFDACGVCGGRARWTRRPFGCVLGHVVFVRVRP